MADEDIFTPRRQTAPDSDIFTPSKVKPVEVPKVVEAKPEPTAVENVGSSVRDIPRQLGLTGRYVMEGLGQVGDIVQRPVAAIVNPISHALGGRDDLIQPLGDIATRAADSMGLPQPQGPTERVVGDASRMLVGTAGLNGVGRLASSAPGMVGQVADALAASPGAQAASAIGGGALGGSVREAGGGPWEQLGASMLGGVATPGLASVIESGGRSAATLANSLRVAPQEVELNVRQTLGRAGIDFDQLTAQARNALVQDASKAVYSGQPLDPQALVRLAHYRNTGATPLVGDITQDPNLLTMQRNTAKAQANSNFAGDPNLPAIENQNAKQVLGVLDRYSSSPMDAHATGEGLISTVQGKDAALKAGEDALYAAARGSSGRSLELDRTGFVNQAFDNLASSNRSAFLPEQITKILNDLSKGETTVGGKAYPTPFNVDTIDQLKTMLASASRGTADGNTKAAIRAVRDALEDVQPAGRQTGSQMPATANTVSAIRTGEGLAKDSLEAFDAARLAARSRREWQESAPFIEDALGGAPPDKFVNTHVINAPVENLAKLKDTITRDPRLVDAVRTQLVDYIKQAGRANSDITTFSGAALEKALERIGPRKLALFFDPQEIGELTSAIKVARYSQAQPIGAAVNNSNSGAMIVGRVLDGLSGAGKWAWKAAQGTPVIGPMVAQPLTGVANDISLTVRGKQAQNLAAALARQPQKPRAPGSSLAPLLLPAAAAVGSQ